MIVKFGMAYEMYGYQETFVPDDLAGDEDAIRDYINDHLDAIPLPDNAEYMPASAEADFEGLFEVLNTEERER